MRPKQFISLHKTTFGPGLKLKCSGSSNTEPCGLAGTLIMAALGAGRRTNSKRLWPKAAAALRPGGRTLKPTCPCPTYLQTRPLGVSHLSLEWV